MWFESLKLTNYRNVGNPGVELLAVSGLNTIVGGNNVGKSSLFAALKTLWDGEGYSASDQHWGSGDAQLFVELAFRLNSEEVAELLRRLIPPLEAATFAHPEGVSKLHGWLEDAKFVYRGMPHELSIGGYRTTDQQLRSTENGVQIGPIPLLERLDNENVAAVLNSIEAVNFSVNLLGTVRQILAPKYKIFADVRTRPKGVGGDRGAGVTESYEGGSTTDYLMNLMTGEPDQRDMFGSIKSHFESFFPRWKFQPVGLQGSPPRLVFGRDGHNFDIEQENVGTGIVEVLTIISNLEGKKGNVFVIEEPELHLHPQSQRALQHLIVESSKENQVFVLTHSPFFVDPNQLAGLCRMWMPDEQARLARFPQNLDDRDMGILKEKFRGLQHREILSCRAALFVEGETEEAFLQAIGVRIGMDTDVYGISIVSVVGQGSYRPYLRLVTEMQIPFLCHRDLRKGIRKLYPEFEDKFRVIGAEFEAFMRQQGLNDIMDEAQGIFGKTRKVEVGRYVGPNMDPGQVPKKFVDLLKEIISSAGSN